MCQGRGHPDRDDVAVHATNTEVLTRIPRDLIEILIKSMKRKQPSKPTASPAIGNPELQIIEQLLRYNEREQPRGV